MRWLGTCWLVLAVGACASPPNTSSPSGVRIEQGGGELLTPDEGPPGYQPRATWEPDSGRFGEYLRTRHLDSRVTARRGEVLTSQDFTTFDADHPGLWTIIGEPRMTFREHPRTGRYLYLGSPRGPGAHGIACTLAGAAVRGQVVRVRLSTWARAAARARYFDPPALRWVAETADGQSHIVSLPLIVGVSADWETQSFLTYFDRSVQRARIELLYEKGQTPCGFDDIVIETVDARELMWLVPPAVPAVHAAVAALVPSDAPMNLIANGDFEVGLKDTAVYGTYAWPGRGSYIGPHPCALVEDAAVGRFALALPTQGAPATIVLGPFRLTRTEDESPIADRYCLTFQAKASAPAEIEATWSIAGVERKNYRFAVGASWAQYQHVFLTPEELLRRPGSRLPMAELSFRTVTSSDRDAVTFWLDGVMFGPRQPTQPYAAASPIEIGILGPAPDVNDLGELVPVGEPVSFRVRLMQYDAAGPFGGEIALDLVDAQDRPVWTSTIRPPVGPNQVWEEQISLSLPRGYYRLLATAWSGDDGASSILSRDERAVGVIDLRDEVPKGSYFGMRADAGTLSARSTQIGTGWVSMPLDLRWTREVTGGSTFTGWTDAIGSARAQDLEIVAELAGLPRQAAMRKRLVREWLSASEGLVTAVYLSSFEVGKLEGAVSTAAPQRTAAQMGLVEPNDPAVLVRLTLDALLHDVGPLTPSSQPATTQPGGARRDGFGLMLQEPPVLLPEQRMETFEQLAARRARFADEPWWDLGVVRQVGSAYRTRQPVPVLSGEPVVRIDALPDPVLSAARLLRAMLLRQLAGIDRAACSTPALTMRTSWLSAPPDGFCEYDHSPRPGLAAWDFISSLLNDATCARWYEKPNDVYVLVFATRGDRHVVAVWRPFGWSLHELVVPKLAPHASAVDMFGQSLLHATRGDDVVMPVNEVIRFLIVESVDRDALIAALDAATVQTP